jgi:hypothetical protein
MDRVPTQEEKLNNEYLKDSLSLFDKKEIPRLNSNYKGQTQYSAEKDLYRLRGLKRDYYPYFKKEDKDDLSAYVSAQKE